MSILLTSLLILNAIILVILIIALQYGNEGGIGTAFGAGNSSGFFGASGGVEVIVRATWILGVTFFVLSTALAWKKTRDQFGVGREIEIPTGTETPAEAPVKE